MYYLKNLMIYYWYISRKGGKRETENLNTTVQAISFAYPAECGNKREAKKSLTYLKLEQKFKKNISNINFQNTIRTNKYHTHKSL